MWGIRTLQNIDLKKNWFAPPPPFLNFYYLRYGRRNPCSPALSAEVSAAGYIRATGRLPDAQALRVYQRVRVLNTGTQPPSWPWFRAVCHPGWGWEVNPDSGLLTQVGLVVCRDNLCHGGAAETASFEKVRRLLQQWYISTLFPDLILANVNEPSHKHS